MSQVRILSSRPSCGCGSMVELKPSKLLTRVRFPSPAPLKPQVRVIIALAFLFVGQIARWIVGRIAGADRGPSGSLFSFFECMAACCAARACSARCRGIAEFLERGKTSKKRPRGVRQRKRPPEKTDDLGLSGAPSRTRTYNRRIRSPMLYPLSHGRPCEADLL